MAIQERLKWWKHNNIFNIINNGDGLENPQEEFGDGLDTGIEDIEEEWEDLDE